MLARRAPELAAELLPLGRREGNEWREASRARGGLGDSLSVHIGGGAKRGLWMHGGRAQGDALDLVAYIRFAGDKKAALNWARMWLGIGDGAASAWASAPRQTLDAPCPEELAAATRAAAEADANRRTALAIFLAAKPIPGTPVEAYLAGRGIALAELGKAPGSLRYAAELFNRESGKPLPAMVAGVRGSDGAMIAVHRTWLAATTAGGWRKAPLQNPKMILGSPTGGCVPLARGASKKPLKDAPAGEVVAIGEGIETCLSVSVSCPELRVLAALSLPNLARVDLPPQIHTVILLRDADCRPNGGGAPNNPSARKGFERAVQHFCESGRTVRVADPTPGCKDFNDSLVAP